MQNYNAKIARSRLARQKIVDRFAEKVDLVLRAHAHIGHTNYLIPSI